jgi:hypothetical protein
MSELKIYFIVSFFVIGFTELKAESLPKPFLFYEDCDFCGCAASSGGLGYTNLSNTSFLGFRFSRQNFESRDGIFNNSPIINETFDAYSLWGKIQISKQFSVSFLAPFQDLKRAFPDGSTENLNGIGDVNTIIWYSIPLGKKVKPNEDYAFTTTLPSKHKLQVGAGLKYPTGEFESSQTESINPGFQVGTGSLDYLFSLNHNYSFSDFGINTGINYTYKTENNNQYRFGNQVNLISKLYYGKQISSSFNVMPFVGISGDQYNEIEEFGQKQPDTDGYVVNSLAGLEANYRNYSLGVNFSLPVKQELFGGDVKAKHTFAIYLNYNLM